ncbi:MAG: hypothetical protein KDD51_15370, partial [Bdellovibrionales bacterium]|nr:hypothetical protein [Bdellovibrionales bacterium]
AAAFATDYAIRRWAAEHFEDLATLDFHDVKMAAVGEPRDCASAIATYLTAPAVAAAVDGVFNASGTTLLDASVRWRTDESNE